MFFNPTEVLLLFKEASQFNFRSLIRPTSLLVGYELIRLLEEKQRAGALAYIRGCLYNTVE